MDPVLDEPQITLLCDLVEASRRVPTARREDFLAFHVMGADPRIPVRHPGFLDHYWAHPQDIEVLRQTGLITVPKDDRNLLIFFVPPRGVRYYEQLKRSTGVPVERVEREVRRLLGSEQFQSTYSAAYAKWALAERLLWGADSADHFSAIGHHCREAMQAFTTALVEKYQPSGVTTNPANTVSRLRSVLAVAAVESDTERGFIDALVTYWGAVSDLVQRQEHGGQKEGRPVTWDDARRVLFQTINVMHEIGRTLERR